MQHIQSLFNIGDHEDIAGFVHSGSAEKRPDERADQISTLNSTLAAAALIETR